MSVFGLLRVLAVSVMLSVFLASTVTAAPFPSLTFQGSFQSLSNTTAFCDSFDCFGELGTTQFRTLPHFGIHGEVLLTVQFSYDVQITHDAVGTNPTNGPVSDTGGIQNNVFFSIESRTSPLPPFLVSDYGCGAPAPPFFIDTFCLFNGTNSNAIVPPGGSLLLASATARVMDSLVLLPGDALFPLFLGPADLSLRVSADGDMPGAEVNDVATGKSLNIQAPILFSDAFSGTFDVTYRYCTPGVDLGCPAAIVGFNSPIPRPATLILFASGFAVVLARAASRRRQT